MEMVYWVLHFMLRLQLSEQNTPKCTLANSARQTKYTSTHKILYKYLLWWKIIYTPNKHHSKEAFSTPFFSTNGEFSLNLWEDHFKNNQLQHPYISWRPEYWCSACPRTPLQSTRQCSPALPQCLPSLYFPWTTCSQKNWQKLSGNSEHAYPENSTIAKLVWG